MDTLSVKEALRFFGLDDVSDLERIVLEYDIDAEVDDAGGLVAIDAADLREPLFAEHERRHGHRPDDPAAVDRARKDQHRHEEAARRRRADRRERLRERHVKK